MWISDQKGPIARLILSYWHKYMTRLLWSQGPPVLSTRWLRHLSTRMYSLNLMRSPILSHWSWSCIPVVCGRTFLRKLDDIWSLRDSILIWSLHTLYIVPYCGTFEGFMGYCRMGFIWPKYDVAIVLGLKIYDIIIVRGSIDGIRNNCVSIDEAVSFWSFIRLFVY